MYKRIKFSVLGYLAILGTSCSGPSDQKGSVLYESHCASCHLAPDIQDLPRHLWKNEVLPEMGARMGIRDAGYNPLEGFSFKEQYAITQSAVYNVAPTISAKEWDILVDYVVSNAPDSLNAVDKIPNATKMDQFEPMPIDLDSTYGSFTTFVDYDDLSKKLITGNLRGKILKYDTAEKELTKEFGLGNAITGFEETDSTAYLTTVGRLEPSEISSGSIHVLENGSGRRLPYDFHRPVHTLVQDLNEDGKQEILVSEFGNLTGQFSMLAKQNDGNFERKVLLNRPGSVRAIARDMNGNGKEDVLVMTSQGDEGVSILYQHNDLDFRAEKVIRFSPVYGSSWFEVLDYDGDGDQDIVTVHGDNGDKTPILKPYHGLRIHLNDGTNQFSEAYFYPFYGATRSVSRDFDEDGDIDIALVSTFPDYDQRPEQSFVYLENQDSSTFDFEPHGLPEDISGRWFLIDAGDFDDDGDEDIVLTCFTYSFNPLPEDLSKQWKESDFDILILKNELIE